MCQTSFSPNESPYPQGGVDWGREQVRDRKRGERENCDWNVKWNLKEYINYKKKFNIDSSYSYNFFECFYCLFVLFCFILRKR